LKAIPYPTKDFSQGDSRVKKNDSLSSLGVFLVGLVFIAEGLKVGLGQFNAPGAGFFPAMVGGLLSLLSIALFVISFSKKNEQQEKRSFWREKGSWKKIALSLLSLVFYLLFLNFLGYLLTTFLFTLSLLKWVSRKGWGPSLLTAFLLSLGSYALFKMGMGVSLPMGLIRM
jgi:putative tricarboxylic transport membrane protein